MLKNTRKKYSKMTLCLFLMISLVPLWAQVSDTTSSRMYFNLAHSIRIEPIVFFGFGFKEFDMFKTTDDETVTISPGGGGGGSIGLGYYFSELFCASVEWGAEMATLSRELKNADGSFYRSFVSSTLRYKFPVSEFSSINAGAGAGYYMSGEMDIDAHKIDEGAHNIYYFKDTAGFHVLCEYEELLSDFNLFNARWSWLAGLKYYYIKYELESAKSNGVKIPVEFIDSRILKDFDDLDGSGIDIIFGVVMHF